MGLPATKLMLEIGAIFMRTDTELILKSRVIAPASTAASRSIPLVSAATVPQKNTETPATENTEAQN
jgi:hypothetical protein